MGSGTRGRFLVVLIATILVAALPDVAAAGSDSTPPIVRAYGTPARADALSRPGAPLADGFVVPKGARRIGPVFPGREGPGYVMRDDGWSAVLLVQGNVVTVVHDLLAQAARQGLTPNGAFTADPEREARRARLSASGIDLPAPDSPACDPIDRTQGSRSFSVDLRVAGYRCSAGASGPGTPERRTLLNLDGSQGACAQADDYCAGLLAPSLLVVSFDGGGELAAAVPFPPAGWVVGQDPVEPPRVDARMPTSYLPPPRHRPIRIPSAAVALTTSRCSQRCNGDVLLLRADHGQGESVVRQMARDTFRRRLYDGGPNTHRGRAGRWRTYTVGMGNTDDSAAYTAFRAEQGPDYVVAHFTNGSPG